MREKIVHSFCQVSMLEKRKKKKKEEKKKDYIAFAFTQEKLQARASSQTTPKMKAV